MTSLTHLDRLEAEEMRARGLTEEEIDVNWEANPKKAREAKTVAKKRPERGGYTVDLRLFSEHAIDASRHVKGTAIRGDGKRVPCCKPGQLSPPLRVLNRQLYFHYPAIKLPLIMRLHPMTEAHCLFCGKMLHSSIRR